MLENLVATQIIELFSSLYPGFSYSLWSSWFHHEQLCEVLPKVAHSVRSENKADDEEETIMEAPNVTYEVPKAVAFSIDDLLVSVQSAEMNDFCVPDIVLSGLLQFSCLHQAQEL